MPELFLYARHDGLWEPRSEKALEFTKKNAGGAAVLNVSDDLRTSLQNRYLNGWIYTKQICNKLNDAGITTPIGSIWTRNTIHAVMQDQFLVQEEFLLNGRHHKVFESTASMGRKRFAEYCGQVSELVYSIWEIMIEEPRAEQDATYYEMLSQIRK